MARYFVQVMDKVAHSPADSAAIRAHNRSQIVRLVWEAKSMSRAAIARHFGLSRSTVSAIVAELINLRLLKDTGRGVSTGGRRPLMVTFQDDAYSLIGVDVGATHVGAALVNLRGVTQGWRHTVHPVPTDPAGTLKLISTLCAELLRDAESSATQLAGIGVALPSPVDARLPGGMSPLYFPAWEGHSVIDALKSTYSAPVFVDNDANLGALAEHWWGAGRGQGNLTYVKLGTGIGSGHLFGGRIYRGATGVAGEIGHVSIDRSGPRCICGLRGCLATYVGAEALCAQAVASGLMTDEQSLGDLVDLVLAGSSEAQRIVGEAGERLGLALASVINLLNPDSVVLGGALCRAGEHLMTPLRQTLQERVPPTSRAEASILVSELGEHANALGAATLVLEHIMSEHGTLPLDTAGSEATA
jgi:predicted NBD/HSP70 family sugar kinase